MSFDERIKQSEIAVEVFDKYLTDNNINYSKSGYEDMVSSPGFMEKIRSCDDGTAQRLRFFPDRTIVNKRCVLVEIKHGKSIEKDAYDNYMELKSIGYDVGIVFYKDENLLFCDISELVFYDAFQWAKLRQAGITMPIINTVWFAPRLMNLADFELYKRIYSTGSSTTFAYINFDLTNFITL